MKRADILLGILQDIERRFRGDDLRPCDYAGEAYEAAIDAVIALGHLRADVRVLGRMAHAAARRIRDDPGDPGRGLRYHIMNGTVEDE